MTDILPVYRRMLESRRVLLATLCPEYCPRCGLESAAGFCPACREEFRRIVSACPRCALPTPCDPCPAAVPDWQLDCVRSPFVYGQPLARYIRAMKFQGRRPLGRVLGLLLGTELKQAGVDALVAVPLHPKRLRLRTFNQAHEIAMPVARGLRRPLLSSSVRRSLETRPQVELGRQDRMLGPLESFSVSRDFSGLRLAIVDDVITTGATVNALARALKSAGAARVDAWSVARSIGTSESASQSTAKM